MNFRRYVPLTMLVMAAFSARPGSGMAECSPAPKKGSVLTLAWNPVVDAAGKRPAKLAGYKIHYGEASRTYRSVIDAGTKTEYTLCVLSPGTYYFAVTAYDTDGKESAYSEEVKKSLR